MRVGIDATPLLLRSAGVKNYLYHWIAHLGRAAEGDELVLFPFLGRVGPLDHERSVAGRLATASRLAFLVVSNVLPNPLAAWAARRGQIFHSTNQVRFPVRGVKLTATLHDLTCWLTPELHTAANVRADKGFAERVLKRAAGLIAVSENTRRDAIRILDLDPEKVTTIYSGVADPFFDVTEEAARKAAERYGLAKPFVLFVGTIEPRKNVRGLIEAYCSLPASIRRDVDLVIAGPLGWAEGDTLRRAGEPGVRYIGYVPEPDLPPLTRAAMVFAYPSLYEGFGFPVAQAMACGVPVVTSNTSCLPEISGDGALHTDPRSASELAAALDRLLSDAALRAELGRNGRRLAERYRWRRCARESWEFFRRVAAR